MATRLDLKRVRILADQMMRLGVPDEKLTEVRTWCDGEERRLDEMDGIVPEVVEEPVPGEKVKGSRRKK